MTTTKNSTREIALNRREVLKALAAIGGAAAASSFLPEKWVKPVVEAGTLPAHAQSSVCSPPFAIDQCADNKAFWLADPTPTLVINSMPYINTRCEGVPLRLTLNIQNSLGQTIYSSDPKIYFTTDHGYAEAIISIPPSKISGIPYLVSVNWEFINSKYGITNCNWKFGITQRK
jgi:hypothetical protein